MKKTKTNKTCKKFRSWLYKTISSRISLDSEWVQNHIANCPRCQRRLASISRVNLALSIIKSQPQKLDLLMRANTQAVGVLKHSLRKAPKARKLKTILPEPRLLERCTKYNRPLANVAACIAILFLMKIGIFSSMDRFQTEGQKVIKQYYAKNVGQDLVDEIFPA